MVSESGNEENNDEDFKVIYDDKNMTIISTMTTTINKEDLTKEDKKTYSAKNYIKALEDSGYVCEITGITREKLGLK